MTEAFIRAYEELKQEVNRRAGDPLAIEFRLGAASDRDPAVRRNRQLLGYVRDVRNVLQHPHHKAPGHAVHVTEGFLGEVEDLLRYLRDPPKARTLGVARRDIRTAGLEEQLGTLAEEMRSRAFSHLPILDGRGAVIGVFNEAAVFAHLWAENETIVAKTMTVAEILDHCRLEAAHTETFDFVGPGEPIEGLMERFLALPSPGQRVGAVFVTASGKRTDPLQRLITAWDVLRHVQD